MNETCDNHKTGKLVGNAVGFRLNYGTKVHYVTIVHRVTVILFGCSTAMQGVLLTGFLRLVEQESRQMR